MKYIPSLLIIGNSNVGKTSIARLLLLNPSKFKGKVGKDPGSTLLIKPIFQPKMQYQIVDLPGFGYMKHSSQRRAEHLKRQIVIHIEKHHQDYFFGLVVLNVLRIQDELTKYFIENKETIPLSFELIKFLRENSIPILILFNKIDKISSMDQRKIIDFFLDSASEYGLTLIHLDNFSRENRTEIPYLEFSALKKTNLSKLKQIILVFLKKQQ